MAATLPTTTPGTCTSRKAFATVARKRASKLKSVAASVQRMDEQLPLGDWPQRAVDDQVEVIRIDFGKLRAELRLQLADPLRKQVDVARPPAPRAIAPSRRAFRFAPAPPPAAPHLPRVHAGDSVT